MMISLSPTTTKPSCAYGKTIMRQAATPSGACSGFSPACVKIYAPIPHQNRVTLPRGTQKMSAPNSIRGWPGTGGSGEFVYAPNDNKLAAGVVKHYVKLPGSRHEQLATALGVAADAVIVGGMLARNANGDFLSSEQSGHFGDAWTPAIRDQFRAWLSARLELPVIHHHWKTS